MSKDHLPKDFRHPIKDEFFIFFMYALGGAAVFGAFILLGKLEMLSFLFIAPAEQVSFVVKLFFILGIIMIIFKVVGSYFIYTEYEESGLFTVLFSIITTGGLGFAWFWCIDYFFV